MIPKQCDVCQNVGTEKLASLYWAWVTASGRRKAWLQRVCADCMRQHYVPLIIAAEQPLIVCPACGESTVDDYDAVYVTYCIPGMPKAQSEMPLCGGHADQLRGLALTGARELPDREAGVGGLGPQPAAISAAETWASLGLRP